MKKDREISALAKELASVHDIKNILELEKLIRSLYYIEEYEPEISLDENSWLVPRGSSSWGETRKKFKSMMEKASFLDEELEKLVADPVALTRLRDIDHSLELPEIAQSLRRFVELLHEAKDLKGKAGNRPHSNLRKKAVEMCQSFWKENMDTSYIGFFHAREADCPGDGFTKWFCDIMKSVYGLSANECQTLLRD